MNESELQELARAASAMLRAQLEKSEQLRRAAALIGRWLCEEAQRAAETVNAPGAKSIEPSVETTNDPIATADDSSSASVDACSAVEPKLPVLSGPRPLPESSGIVPLKLGDAVVHVPLTGTTEELGRARAAASSVMGGSNDAGLGSTERLDVDLKLVAERCRLKAASCRLFIEKRNARPNTPEERAILERLNAMIAQAKSKPNCFLWVFWREKTQPDDEVLTLIADCYEALAEAIDLVRRIDETEFNPGSEVERAALQLLAEANSALRAAMEHTWLNEDDRDQLETHVWLRRETAARQVYIDRFMTADDRADPAQASDLRSRIASVVQHINVQSRHIKDIKNALGQIKYHARMVVKNGGSETDTHWKKIAEAARRLEGMGIKPTDRRIGDAIGADAAKLWTGATAETSCLSEVIDGIAAKQKDSASGVPPAGSDEPRAWSDQVLDVRRLLRGTRMVVIGGVRNAQAAERLIEAFELKDVEWVVLTEHGSGAPMRAPIQRSDTSVVIVIVKLAGHLHAEEARRYAGEARKPCVLLTGGYNPEKVAVEIMKQASERLPIAASSAARGQPGPAAIPPPGC